MAQSSPQAAKAVSVEKEPPRPVICFDCGHPHKVARASTSSLCPQCGCYIDLRDVVIKDRTTQKIRTRGNVVVEKKAALLGTSITCDNLSVFGQISGSIYASGEVIFKTSGKVLGEIRCKRLLVEKKSQLQFLQPIHAELAEIHGETTGHFHCSEKMHLGRHGSIVGSLRAKRVKMELGAQLTGRVEILPQPRPTVGQVASGNEEIPAECEAAATLVPEDQQKSTAAANSDHLEVSEPSISGAIAEDKSSLATPEQPAEARILSPAIIAAAASLGSFSATSRS